MVLDVDAEIGYARGQVLQRVALTVGPGETVLLRGANGVGKSTLLATVAGLRPPLSGSVRIAGAPAASTRAKRFLGHVTDPPNLFEELTPAEHLELARSMWLAARVPVTGVAASGAFLDGVPDLPAGMLSLGQRKRLGLALAVLHGPVLWVLDEPFNGLDVAACARLRDRIGRHAAAGGSVLLATHDEAALGDLPRTVLELGAARRAAPAGPVAAGS